jgi:multidrug efflux pump subunit AcrA (membrane-fusion protein)
VESSRRVDVRCPGKGEATVGSFVPQGSRVAAGAVVVTLDTPEGPDTVRAPEDGFVLYRTDVWYGFELPPRMSLGARIHAGEFLFRLHVADELPRMDAKVAEDDSDKIRPGQEARMRVNGLWASPLSGRVVSINPLHDSDHWHSHAHGEPRFYSTFVAFDNPPSGLRPGMTAKVEILVRKRDDVLILPAAAVIRLADKDRVAVKRADGGFDWHDVTMGVSNGTSVEIKDGIKSGDAVALAPQALWREQEKGPLARRQRVR